MKKQRASFRDFLATGILGPVSPEMRLIEVAQALGSPDGWNTNEGDAIPVYWFFGKLEISFDSIAPYSMNWFQIEGVSQIEGELESLTKHLQVSLDGFSGATRPSEFLAAGLWDPTQASVYYAALSDEILLNLCAGGIQIHFQVDTSFLGNRDALEYFNRSTALQLVRDIDCRTEVDSIYSYPRKATEDLPGVFNWQCLGGQDYLNLVR